VFKWCSEDLSATLSETSLAGDAIVARRCFLGQPVDVAEESAVLRIALGAEALGRICQGELTEVLAEDRLCVEKLALLAERYELVDLAESGQAARTSVKLGSVVQDDLVDSVKTQSSESVSN